MLAVRGSDERARTTGRMQPRLLDGGASEEKWTRSFVHPSPVLVRIRIAAGCWLWLCLYASTGPQRWGYHITDEDIELQTGNDRMVGVLALLIPFSYSFANFSLSFIMFTPSRAPSRFTVLWCDNCEWLSLSSECYDGSCVGLVYCLCQ